MLRCKSPLALVSLSVLSTVASAQRSLYQPPAPLINSASPALDKVAQRLNKLLNDYIVANDAGTPNCISWQQTVDVSRREELPLNEFLLEMGDGGENVGVEAPALGVIFKRS